jgi:hypothetical protein
MHARSRRPGSSRSRATSPPSPYRRALPAEADLPEDPLHLRLDFHQETVVLHDYAESATRTRLVSALDVAHALARELDLTTGLLPPGALWWAKTATGVRVAVWCEPRVWTVRLRERYDAPPERLRLPMPGLVFVCLAGGQAPFVFAATRRPCSANDQLYGCPTYNVYPTGRVCAGTHVFPTDPARVPGSFFESHFSAAGGTGGGKSRRHPEDVGQLWAELRGRREYPCDDLIPQLRVADALRIGE